MSKSVNSPTARLLQSSRLFSLPRALPQPGHERTGAISLYRNSDSATLPYPTRQSVTTIPSSHSKGDWGLKRGLPLKATRGTGTPHVRVQANDTRYQITDYASSADHTQTRAKWQELGIPLVRFVPKTHATANPEATSAYEDALDITDPADGERDVQRWKTAGPWVAGMEEGEFNEYVLRTLSQKKQEWRKFLQTVTLEDRVVKARKRAQHKGEVFDQTHEERFRAEQNISGADLDAAQKELRDNHLTDGNNSRLTALMATFLDLAHIQQTPAVQTYTTNLSASLYNVGVGAEGLNRANPLSTHPAAGLSYLRTNAVMENHPLHGPQESRSPVLSRVLRYKDSHLGKQLTAKLGVAGVVADDSFRSTFARDGSSAYERQLVKGVEHLNHESESGSKVWVTPEDARISEKGTIMLRSHRSSNEAVAVKTRNVGRIHEQRRQSFVHMTMPDMQSRQLTASPASSAQHLSQAFVPQTTQTRRGTTSRPANEMESLLNSQR